MNIKVEQLIEQINEIVDNQTSYYLENHDNGTAEFVESFYYGELNFDSIMTAIKERFEPEDYEPLEQYLYNVLKNDRERFEFLGRHCDLDCTGIYISHNEILSEFIGEQEEQLPAELVKELKDISAEELYKVKQGIDAYMGDNIEFIYIDLSYHRWVLELDIDEALIEIEYQQEGE